MTKSAQTVTTMPALVVPVSAQGKKKKKISPEAVEAIKHLQETPTDIWSQQSGPGAALRATGIGGGVGAGLGFTVGGVTAGGHKVPLSTKKLKEIASEAAKLSDKPKAQAKFLETMERGLRSRKARVGALVGAGTGLASSLYYQGKRKGLKKKIEKELGMDDKKSKKKTAAWIIGGVQIPVEEK